MLRAWESLPEYGVSLFVVKFHGEKKEELLVSHLFLRLRLVSWIMIDLDDSEDDDTFPMVITPFSQGVGNNKIMRMSLPGGEHIKTWRYSTMKVFILSSIHLRIRL